MAEKSFLKGFCPKHNRYFGMTLEKYKGRWEVVDFIPLSKEEAKRGGIASGIARRRKATMLSTLEMLLDETNPKAGKTYRELATLGLIKGAVNGSSKNYEVISNLISE